MALRNYQQFKLYLLAHVKIIHVFYHFLILPIMLVLELNVLKDDKISKNL